MSEYDQIQRSACKRCGQESATGVRYCDECGMELESEVLPPGIPDQAPQESPEPTPEELREVEDDQEEVSRLRDELQALYRECRNVGLIDAGAGE